MIIESRVLCFRKHKGVIEDFDKEEDLWLPLTFDMSEVVAVKKNYADEQEDSFCGPDKAVVYFRHNDYMVIDMDYDVAVEAFKKSRQ